MKQNLHNSWMIEPGSGPMPEDDNSGAAPAAKPSARKSKMVTKEELEKSGMSLRDYMNKQQGLTRRKERDPTAGDSPDKAAQAAADAIDPGADANFSQKMNMSSYKPRRTPNALSETRRPGTNTNYENKETSDMSYKKGGSVSSASKRADGIATKGKTRGKMC
jgi:hypothetical protein